MPDILSSPEMGGPRDPINHNPYIAGADLPPNPLSEEELGRYFNELENFKLSQTVQAVGSNAIHGAEAIVPQNLAQENGEQLVADFNAQLEQGIPDWFAGLEETSDLSASAVKELEEELKQEAHDLFKSFGSWSTKLSKLIKQSADLITAPHRGSKEKRKKKGGKGIDPWWATKCPKHVGEERWKCATGIGPDRMCKHWKGYTIDK